MSQSQSGNQGSGSAPWWSSARPEPEPMPLAGLVAGMQAALSWARERVLVPHADHADPGAYPECLACRAQVVLARLVAAPDEPPGAPVGQPEPVPPPVRIEWIELDPPRT